MATTPTHGGHSFSNGARANSPEDVIAKVLAEAPNKAESPSRRAKTISAIFLGHANDDVNDVCTFGERAASMC